SEERGYQLTVETLPFESTLGVEPPPDPSAQTPAPAPSPLPPWLQKLTKDMPAGLLIGAAIGVALMAILPIAWLLFRKRRRPVGALAESPAALSQSEEEASG